jgi:hypothetical protein
MCRYHSQEACVIGIVWDLYQSHRIGQLDDRLSAVETSKSHDKVARDAAFGLEDKMDRLALICGALFELMQTAAGITEEQLRKKISVIDLRDGQADGRVTQQPKKCPNGHGLSAHRCCRMSTTVKGSLPQHVDTLR